jgi:hypothetical protein
MSKIRYSSDHLATFRSRFEYLMRTKERQNCGPMLIFYFLDTDFSTGARPEGLAINLRHRKFKSLDATKSDIDSNCVFRLGCNMVDMHLRSAIPPRSAARSLLGGITIINPLPYIRAHIKKTIDSGPCRSRFLMPQATVE